MVPRPARRYLYSMDFKSIVLTSSAPDTTVAFYRDRLGLPLEAERHRGTERHWAGQIGALHFAIHPREGFWLPEPSGTIVSFTVDDVEAFAAARALDVCARTRIGPISFIAVPAPA